MKIIAKKANVTSTAVQHVAKHFDLVLGIDIHWTKLPVPPIPLPLPHPFIGFIFDPMEYADFSIPVPSLLQKMFNLPEKIPMGASVFVHGRIKATTTTSVFGFGCSIKPKGGAASMLGAAMVGNIIPIKHITGGLPFYKIFLGDLEGPHDGEIYFGSESVIINGSECSGSFPQQVLTCWGIPFGHQYFPPAWLALYQHILTMYVQINVKPPVLVGGTFIPHKYTLSDILMRAAAVLFMKALGAIAKKGLTKFNHFLQGKFGKNPISKLLCFFGLEPVNFVTGAMNFSWDDFELFGERTIRWTSAWQSDITYSGIMGNGVICNYDLFIIPQEADGVAAYNNPDENQVFPIPMPEVGGKEEYYRSLKLWQHRPNKSKWIVRTETEIRTYRAFSDEEYGTIYLTERIDYVGGGFLLLDYSGRKHLLSTIKDHLGRLIIFGQDEERGLIRSAMYKHGDVIDQLVAYDYDEKSNLIRVRDRFGKSIEFEYDGANRVVLRRNRNNMTYTWEYDAEGRVIHTTGEGGVQEGYISYHDGYNEVRYSATGATEQYYYDGNNLVYKKVDAMGGETWYGYNSWHERTLVGTPEGKVVGYDYDDRGNLIRLTAADGAETVYEYDDHNRLIARTDAASNREEWVYDTETALLLKHKEADGTVVTYTYEKDKQQPSAIEYGEELRAVLQYDTLGLISNITDGHGVCETFAYDDYGRPLKHRHADGNSTEWQRDRLGRVTRYATHGQSVMRISYDAYDLPVEVTSGNEVWTMEYTPMGNLRRQTRRTSSMRMVSALNYEYDSYDQLKFVENEHGERYFFERDLNGEVICERGFDGLERHYIRDLDGTVITTQLPDGTAVHHQHDQAGRLTYNKYTDGSWEAWEYDKAGRLTKAYNRDSVTEFVRNALGQVIKETQDGRTVEHKYDERSQLSNIVSALGGSITYGYDIKGAVNHISAGMSGKRKPWEADIVYDRFGRETSRMMPGCVENTMHYDSIGRPAHQRVRHNGQTLYDKSYTWGDNLRLLRTFDTINGRSVRYDYDTFGSLSGAVFGDGSRQWRNPDLMGNVYDSPDRTDRSYGRGGQLREDKKWRYYYDSHGNLVLKTMRRSGPSLETGMRDEFLAWQSGDYAYTWQGNGMLRSVTRPDGKTVTFKYDALGRRIEKVFDGRVYRYLWNGDVILHEWDYAEADRPNTIVTETGEVTLDRPEPVENPITWVYDSDSYVPTAKIVGDRHYSIVSDYIGRPVQAYDDNGNIVWQADYDIYGNVRNLNGSRQFIPFRQLGQYEDEETGLYYNRFRYYDPRIGIYISQDPIGLAGNNPTLYGYVSDSNNRMDLLGLNKTSWWLHDSDGSLLDSGTMKPDPKAKTIPGRVGDSEQKILKTIETRHAGNLEGTKLTINSEPTFIKTPTGKTVKIEGIKPCDFCDARMDEFTIKNKMQIEYNYRGKQVSYPKTKVCS